MRMNFGRSLLTALGVGLAAGIWIERPSIVTSGSAVAGAAAGESDASVSGSSAYDPTLEAPPAPGLRLVINLAARRLHVYENGKRTHTFTVAIGKEGHSTPRGTFHISRVIWNPWWHPPNRPWARGQKPTPQGPNNPMGRVKMYFLPLYYIHGTPHTGSLGQAASHGCVRLSNKNAIALARLVHKYGSPDLSSAQIDRIVANSKATRTIWLKRRIPVEIVSRSADVIDGRLEFYAVAAERTAEEVRSDALEALAAAGYDAAAVNEAELDALVNAAADGPVSSSLDALFAAPAAVGLVE